MLLEFWRTGSNFAYCALQYVPLILLNLRKMDLCFHPPQVRYPLEHLAWQMNKAQKKSDSEASHDFG